MNQASIFSSVESGTFKSRFDFKLSNIAPSTKFQHTPPKLNSENKLATTWCCTSSNQSGSLWSITAQVYIWTARPQKPLYYILCMKSKVLINKSQRYIAERCAIYKGINSQFDWKKIREMVTNNKILPPLESMDIFQWPFSHYKQASSPRNFPADISSIFSAPQS